MIKDKDKIILDLCGGTGSWSKPYQQVGYKVHLITLPDYDVFQSLLYHSYIVFYGQGGAKDIKININEIYGILAAPTCTHFSLARTTAKEPRDFTTAMNLVKKCLEIIWHCRINGKLKFWALENPMGYLRQFLGRPLLTWQPCDFGEPYTKKTDLWGYYNLPVKRPVKLNDQQMRDCSINNRILPPVPEGYKMPGDIKAQAIRRSITPKGFAEAFYKANK